VVTTTTTPEPALSCAHPHAVFTKKLISQSSALPGCNNTISVTIVQNVPLPANGSSLIITFNPNISVGLKEGNVTLRGLDATSFNSVGVWSAANNSLRLAVSSDLPVCTNISFEFTVCNPASVASPMSEILLQDSKPVNISAEGAGVRIRPVEMDSAHLPTDAQPLRVYAPLFTVKKIGQSSPWPGVNNTITVTVATNFNMVSKTRVVLHGFEGVELLSDGDVLLQGPDAGGFVSMAGSLGHGTWVGCDSALVLELGSELGCNTSSFTISFVVTNPLLAQDCVNVRINATVPSACNESSFFTVTQQRIAANMAHAIGSRTADSYSEAYLAHSENGFDMEHDLATELPIFGAMMGDACPLLIWPAVFLIKDISQSSPWPCASDNTISITIATNVLLFSSSSKNVSITVSQMFMATPLGMSDGKVAITTSNTETSGVLTPVSSFDDGDSTTAVWTTDNITNMSSMTLNLNAGVECCVPDTLGNGLTVIEFNVTNAALPQAQRTVTVSADGAVVILGSAMRHDHGNKWAFFVKSPAITLATISQSSSAPCSENTVILRFKFNSNLVCASTISVTGLASVMTYADVKNISGTGYSGNVTWKSDTLIVPITSTLAKGDLVDLRFSFFNPGMVVFRQAVAPTAFFFMSDNVLDKSRIAIPDNELEQPLTVSGAAFSTAVIVQSSPFQGEINTISITLSTTAALRSFGPCASAITISGLHGACVAGNTLQLFGDSQVLSHESGGSTGGTALWNSSDSSVVMFIVKDEQIAANQKYVLHFNVTNPAAPQESNAVSIWASGVEVPRIAMSIGADTKPGVVSCNTSACDIPFAYRGVQYSSCTNVDYGDKYWCATNASRADLAWVDCTCDVEYMTYSIDVAPLHVRGFADFETFKIGGSSSKPGHSNVLCVTLSANVPLVASLPVKVTVSGLLGANASSGALVLNSTQTSSKHFDSVWDNVEKRMVFTVIDDTVAGVEYSICGIVTNPRCAQRTQPVLIEASGIVIQPTAPSSVGAILMVEEAKITETSIQQLDSTAGGPNELTIRFTSTVNLAQTAGKASSIIVRGLRGVVLPTGTVSIGGSSSTMFSACKRLDGNEGCNASTGIWGDSRDTLTLYLVSSLTAMDAVEVKFNFTNSETSQDGLCSIAIEIHAEELGCQIAPAPIMSASELRGTTKEALRIHGQSGNAICFPVKMVSQSTSSPGATNTITLSLRPPVSVSADHVIVIAGLIGATTPDAMLRLLNSSSVFRPRARWSADTGTLTLALNGQNLSSSHVTTVTFDLANPHYPQESPALITVSVPGHMEIDKCAMDTGTGEAAPLEVVSPQFTVRTVQHNSTIMGGANLITVSLRPNVVLSKTRKSVIVLQGLFGSRTADALSLPLTIVHGQGLALEASWRQSTGSLSIQVVGEIETTKDTVFSFVLHNGWVAVSQQISANSTHAMALGMVPIGATSLTGNALHIADLNGAQEIIGVCTCPSSADSTSCVCSTTLTEIAQGRSLYALKVELQCNSHAANLTISAGASQLDGIMQPPTSCHDQCQTYHTALGWTPLDPNLLVNSTSIEVEIAGDGLQTDYCGAGHMLKAVFTLRIAAAEALV